MAGLAAEVIAVTVSYRRKGFVMRWMNYVKQGAQGLTRVHLGRGRRRILLALLSGADNLHGFRLVETAQVGSGTLYPFLAHLERARWIEGHYMEIGGRSTRCYSLTALGRRMAIEELRLVYGRQERVLGRPVRS